MPEKTEFPAGTPSWADLATRDVDASATFYGTLFGWRADRIDDPAAGGYTLLSHDGRTVAALGPLPSPELPAGWQVYVAVDDADKTCELARGAGGTVVVPPMDVLDAGRMAKIADPGGAAISVWQAGTMKGASLVDEPVSLSWIELTTRDTDGAKAFYTEVFGWGAESSDGEMPYTEFKLGETSVAGMMAPPPEMPAEVPASWMPYFQVADIERTTREASALGANVLVPPSPVPGERLTFAVVSDPAGATFGLLQNVAPATDA